VTATSSGEAAHVWQLFGQRRPADSDEFSPRFGDKPWRVCVKHAPTALTVLA